MTQVDSKHISDSLVTLAQFMQPEHANALGNVHGGVIMKFIDEAGVYRARPVAWQAGQAQLIACA